MTIIFWISIAIIFYTYIGYGLLLFVLVRIKRKREIMNAVPEWPSITLIVAAYNEEDVVGQKIKNSLELDYPPEKLRLLFVTDGSTDRTPHLVQLHPEATLLHDDRRRGKIHAINRAMQQVTSDIAVFTDANTFLNREALLKIAYHYSDPKVGAVAGEKQVEAPDGDATAGEGLYWKYESKLKQWDAELCSVVGAAGELFSVRTHLYQPVPEDTILDDFIISLRIAAAGYRVAYEPRARATEQSSASLQEELKRKIRIAAGGIQAISRLKPLLNVFRYGTLSFQYISHRVLRWTITPILLPAAYILNLLILFTHPDGLYFFLFIAQTAFYLAAGAGYMISHRPGVPRLLLFPAYFCMMNYAVIAGMLRYLRGKQSAAWERVQRRPVNHSA